MRAVAHRCPCGDPDVVETSPRLPDGTPFPTLYYLTCPRATAAVGRLEASGLMREMTERLRSDEALAAAYRAAHDAYLARRRELGDVPEMVYSPFWYVVPVPENGPPTSSAVQPDGKGLAPGVAIVRDASIVLLTESLDPLSLNQ